MEMLSEQAVFWVFIFVWLKKINEKTGSSNKSSAKDLDDVSPIVDPLKKADKNMTKQEEMGSLDKFDEHLQEGKCVAENLNLDDVTTIVESLKEAGKDLSKQVPPLVKLGEWYLNKAKTTINANDFTKANALFNAALVRSRHVRHEIDENQILRRIVETYRKFLVAFGKDDDRMSVDNNDDDDDDGMSADKILNEIDSHKEWVARERRIFKERINEIDLNEIDQNHETVEDYKVLKILKYV